MIQALLWDVDGTLAETERDGHRLAFNEAFASMGLGWSWDCQRYGELLRTTGGRERILRDMASRADAPPRRDDRDALAAELHRRKNVAYERRLSEGAIQLRPGVPELLDEAAAQGLRQAVVTTTSRANWMALQLQVLERQSVARFGVVVCGEDVTAKKPDPQAYRLALDRLGLGPASTLAVEDSPAGVTAARGAGVPVVVTRSAYFPDDPVEGATATGPGLHTREGWSPATSARNAPGRVRLDDLIEWHARAIGVAALG